MPAPSQLSQHPFFSQGGCDAIITRQAGRGVSSSIISTTGVSEEQSSEAEVDMLSSAGSGALPIDAMLADQLEQQQAWHEEERDKQEQEEEEVRFLIPRMLSSLLWRAAPLKLDVIYEGSLERSSSSTEADGLVVAALPGKKRHPDSARRSRDTAPGPPHDRGSPPGRAVSYG